MDAVLDKLKQGVRHFQRDIYPQQASLFQQAAHQRQQPHTLFIACADSRVDPVAITGAAPGDVFVARNIGNMVPAYGEALGGVSAVIEFAVTGLKVRHVVICGHTGCGAMNALLLPESAAAMPTVQSWLTNAHAALIATRSITNLDTQQNPADLLRVLTEQNVLLQMQHLKTHPSAAKAIARGELTISGWIYNIATGDVQIAEQGQQTFVAVR